MHSACALYADTRASLCITTSNLRQHPSPLTFTHTNELASSTHKKTAYAWVIGIPPSLKLTQTYSLPQVRGQYANRTGDRVARCSLLRGDIQNAPSQASPDIKLGTEHTTENWNGLECASGPHKVSLPSETFDINALNFAEHQLQAGATVRSQWQGCRQWDLRMLLHSQYTARPAFTLKCFGHRQRSNHHST